MARQAMVKGGMELTKNLIFGAVMGVILITRAKAHPKNTLGA
jgi:hypothetical protein